MSDVGDEITTVSPRSEKGEASTLPGEVADATAEQAPAPAAESITPPPPKEPEASASKEAAAKHTPVVLPKQEALVTPKPEPKVEPKVEPKMEPKVEPEVEPEVTTVLTVNKEEEVSGKTEAAADIKPAEAGELDEARLVMKAKEVNKQTAVKTGSILWTWGDGKIKRKVPYFIVPDSFENDPLILEKVTEAMGLAFPNLVLRFSRVAVPLQEWNGEWTFKAEDEDDLPFPIPLGIPRTKEDIAKYMISVAQDRVANILSGVSSACAQAGAWLNVSHNEEGEVQFGLHDYVPGMISSAADKDAMLYATYVMEDARVNGGKEFCDALHHFSSDIGSAKFSPKTFHEDISVEMDLMGLNFITNSAKETSEAKVKEDKLKASAQLAHASDPAAWQGRREAMARERKELESSAQSALDKKAQGILQSKLAYLPSKDVTHLIVFESKATETAFNSLLGARTPQGTFIMAGDETAMRLFGDSVKNGTPVFLLRGTGGCANQAALVYDHMKWRKRLDEASVTKNGDVPIGGAGAGAQVGCFGGPAKGEEGGEDEGKEGGEDQDAGGNGEEVDAENKGESEDAKFSLGKALQNLRHAIEIIKEKLAKELQEGMVLQAAVTKLVLAELEAERVTGDAFETRVKTMLSQQVEKKTVDEIQAEAPKIVLRIEQVVKKSATTRKVNKEGKFEDGKDEERLEEAAAKKAAAGNTDRSFGMKDPEDLYKKDLEIGTLGRAWERKVRMSYETWFKKQQDLVHEKKTSKAEGVEAPPEGWSLAAEGDEECERSILGTPCYREDCAECYAGKKRERKNLRNLAQKNMPWETIDKALVFTYIRWGQQMNPISDDPLYARVGKKDPVAQLARVLFSNVYYPPTEDAVVVIDMLSTDLEIEDIMDQVTGAMSSDIMHTEIGEKTAFRRRLLMAWQMVLQLQYNAKIHKKWMHILQLLIILFTFVSVLFGTLTSSVAQTLLQVGLDPVLTPTLEGEERDAAEARMEPWKEESGWTWFNVIDFHAHSVNINLVMPLLTALLMALNARWAPTTKYNTLKEAHVFVEGEIFKCRTRTGDYSGSASGASTLAAEAQEAEDKEAGPGAGGKKKKASAPKGGGNPRHVFAKKMEGMWNDLASSEVRQESLQKPSSFDLISLNKHFECVEHPSLYEEGKVLISNNKELIRQTLKRFKRHVDDDGLRSLSAGEYIDIRVTPFRKLYEGRSPDLRRNLTWFTVVIFCLTSVCTGLGAFENAQWIPVTMGISAGFAAALAYTQCEQRMYRTNQACISIKRLMIWWWGLSVIEQRIPSNKSFLVGTMETIIQAEAGTIRVASQKEDQGDDSNGNEAADK